MGFFDLINAGTQSIAKAATLPVSVAMDTAIVTGKQIGRAHV